MRTFIAVDIPDGIKQEMAKVQERLRQAGVDAGWTRPEGMHMTLKFLGEVHESRVKEIMSALKTAVSGSGVFRLEIAGAGAFPNAQSARVVWIGVGGELDRLTRLYSAVEDAMAGLGFAREERTFTPHLTIGRIKLIRSRGRWAAALDEIRNMRLPGFDVTGVNLMRSELRRSGAIYTEIGKAEFR